MCRAIIYAANTNSQTVDDGRVINFGNIVRRYGCNCNVSGGNVIVSGTGYYEIDTDFTFQSGGDGTAVITLYQDGVEIPGGKASLSVATDLIYAVSVPAVIRQRCGCDSTIRAILSGVSGTFTNAAIVVDKE